MPQHGGDFVYAPIELLESDDRGGFVFRLRYKNQRRFVFVFGKVPVYAVVAGVEFAANKPFPKWRIAGVQRGVPILIPMQEFGVLAKTFGKILLAETFDHRRVVQIGLANKFRRGIKTLFFFPVHGDLRFVLSWSCSSGAGGDCGLGLARGLSRVGF